jgi:hypothetical protein
MYKVHHFCEALRTKAYQSTNSEEVTKLYALIVKINEQFVTEDASLEEMLFYCNNNLDIDSSKPRKERRKERNHFRKILSDTADHCILQNRILSDTNENNIEFPELNAEIDRLVRDD